MPRWEWRLVRRDGILMVHAVYVNDYDEVIGFEEEAASPSSDSVTGFHGVLDAMREASVRPLLEFDDLVALNALGRG